jgi:hypothetical protein
VDLNYVLGKHLHELNEKGLSTADIHWGDIIAGRRKMLDGIGKEKGSAYMESFHLSINYVQELTTAKKVKRIELHRSEEYVFLTLILL